MHMEKHVLLYKHQGLTAKGYNNNQYLYQLCGIVDMLHQVMHPLNLIKLNPFLFHS